MASTSPSALLLPNGLNFTKRSRYYHNELFTPKTLNFKLRYLYSNNGKISASAEKLTEVDTLTSRRNVLRLIVAISAFGLTTAKTNGASLPPEQTPRLCDDACEKELENAPVVTTESGLQFKEIQVGVGPSPPVGFQVTANYVAMVPNGQVFDRSEPRSAISAAPQPR